jgi:hypothetical protein
VSGIRLVNARRAFGPAGGRSGGPPALYRPGTILYSARASTQAAEFGHAPGRHLEDVRSAGRVEHVRALEETRERLTVLAVADETEAGGRGNVARNTAHAAAPAPKREVHDDIVVFDIVRHENDIHFDQATA